MGHRARGSFVSVGIPAHLGHEPQAPRSPGPRLVPCPGPAEPGSQHDHRATIHRKEGPMTTTLAPELKTTNRTLRPLPTARPASSPPTGSRRPAGPARRARHQALHRRPAQAPGPRDRRRLAPPGARHDPRDPGRQRLRQVHADPPRLGAADAGRGPGRGVRPRHRARRARREAAHQPGVSVDAAFFKKLSPMENLLFAARLYGLDAARGAAAGDGDPRPARASRRAVSAARWSR